MKQNNIRVMGMPEREDSKQGTGNLLEKITTKNFHDVVKGKDTQVQGAHTAPNKVGPKTPTLRHIIIKMTRLKNKERILKAEEQVVTYKGASMRLSSDYSPETFLARREWHEIFKVMESKDLQPRLLYPAMLSLTIEGEIWSFVDKKKLEEFANTKPLLKQMLKGLL